MDSLLLNETPVRTSKNFGINNINVDVEFPNEVKEFNNFWVESKSKKDNIIELEDIEENVNLKYGTGLLSNHISNRNKQILVEVNSKIDNNIKLFFDFDSKNKNLIETIHIVAKEETASTIYILFKSEKNIKAFHSGVLVVVPASGKWCHICIVINKESYIFKVRVNKCIPVYSFPIPAQVCCTVKHNRHAFNK